jgi:hypothetical protein
MGGIFPVFGFFSENLIELFEIDVRDVVSQAGRHTWVVWT